MNWLQSLPSTNSRIAVTLLLAVGTAVRYLGFGLPESSQTGWNSWLVFVAVMAGIDASQYIGKRFSDTEYATAKNATSPPVTVSTPQMVVAPTASSAPVNVTTNDAAADRRPPLADVRTTRRVDHDERSDD